MVHYTSNQCHRYEPAQNYSDHPTVPHRILMPGWLGNEVLRQATKYSPLVKGQDPPEEFLSDEGLPANRDQRQWNLSAPRS